MTPVQRVTRYNLLLSDIAKCFKKAGDEEIYENLRSALEHAHEICEYANNMMIAGRISGFPVSTMYVVLIQARRKWGAQSVELELRWRFCVHGSTCPEIYL